MYNEKLKTRFIHETGSDLAEDTYYAAVKVFEAFAPHEEVWGADLCTMSAKQLQTVLDGMTGIRMQSQRPAQLIRRYIEWCIRQRVPGVVDKAFDVEDIGLEKLRQQMVSVPSICSSIWIRSSIRRETRRWTTYTAAFSGWPSPASAKTARCRSQSTASTL